MGETDDSGARAKKYSVSMPEEVADEVRARVGKGSFSAYVTASVKRQIERDRLAELIDDYESEAGPIPQEHMDAVTKEFDEAERRYTQWLAEQPAPKAS